MATLTDSMLASIRTLEITASCFGVTVGGDGPFGRVTAPTAALVAGFLSAVATFGATVGPVMGDGSGGFVGYYTTLPTV
jgi:hypothetical protein